MAETLLRVEALDAAYEAVQVVWGINLQVQAGTVTSLIGPNGAGKTTTMNVIAGTLPARSGKIIFQGEDITSKPPHLRVEMRLSLIPEQRQLWPRMSVEENLLLGAFPRRLRAKAGRSVRRKKWWPRVRTPRFRSTPTRMATCAPIMRRTSRPARKWNSIARPSASPDLKPHSRSHSMNSFTPDELS